MAKNFSGLYESTTRLDATHMSSKGFSGGGFIGFQRQLSAQIDMKDTPPQPAPVDKEITDITEQMAAQFRLDQQSRYDPTPPWTWGGTKQPAKHEVPSRQPVKTKAQDENF